MLCTKCQSEAKIGAKYCSDCGTSLPASGGAPDLAKFLQEVQASVAQLEKAVKQRDSAKDEQTRPLRNRGKKPSQSSSSPPDLLPERWYTTEELAKRIGQSALTLRWWRSVGKGPRFLKIGKRVFYPISWVEAYLAEMVKETDDAFQSRPRQFKPKRME